MRASGVDRRATFHALLCGAASLLPVPLLDEQLVVWAKRRMVTEVMVATLRPQSVRTLSGTPRRFRVEGCLLWAILLPLRLLLRLLLGLFRKLLFMLNVKKSIDVASHALHEAVLLASLADREAQWIDRHAELIRAALEATTAAVDPRPVEKALRGAMSGGRRLIRRAARLLLRRDRRRSLAEEESLLQPLSDSVAGELAAERAYFSALQARFRRELDARLAALPPG